jgi:hypothetical protein
MNEALEYLRRIDTSSPLLYWVFGSLLAYVVGQHVLWLLRSRILWRSPYRGPVEQIGRFLFFLGIPYLALGGWPRPPMSGQLSLHDMGLVGSGPRWPATRWLQAAGSGLGLGVVAAAILLLAWANANRRSGQGSQGPGLRFSPVPWWLWLIDLLYLEVHWAFYRGALTLLLGEVYSAVFVSLALVFLQWGLSPLWRKGWGYRSQAADQWLRSALALIAALTFLTTRNLWICLLVHGLIELPFRRFGRERVAPQAVSGLPDAVDVKRSP